MPPLGMGYCRFEVELLPRLINVCKNVRRSYVLWPVSFLFASWLEKRGRLLRDSAVAQINENNLQETYLRQSLCLYFLVI